MAQGIPARLTRAEGRKFGLTVGTAFGVLAAISAFRGHHVPPYVFGSLSVALILGGLLVPGSLGPVNRAWMAFGLAISKVTTPIVLGIVFFVVITPMGLLMRVFGHNPIRHRPVGQSYWAPRTGTRGSMSNQF